MYLHVLIYDIILVKAILTASTKSSTEKVILRGSIELNCSVSDNVTSKSWARPSKNNTELHNGKIFNKKAANVDKFQIDNKDNAYNLIITNISKQEQGLFCCERVINQNNVTQMCTIVQIIDKTDLGKFNSKKDSNKSEKAHPNGIMLYIASMFSGIIIICVAAAVYIKYSKINVHKDSKKRQIPEPPSEQNTSRYYSEIVEINHEQNGARFVILDRVAV